MEDICGENKILPRHSKAYVNLRKMREEIEIERVNALKKFVKESQEGLFPSDAHSVNVDQNILDNFLKNIK
jgi:3-methyl-2-oxobutanoate hydroxymethyltransferase